MKKPAAITLAATALLLLAGCAALPQATVPTAPVQNIVGRDAAPGNAPPAEAAAFVLKVNDELEVRFPDRPELSQVARIRPDGKIALPWINAIQAEGRSPEELEAAIASAYREVSGKTEGKARYLIAPNDELEVRFPYQATMNQTTRVRPDGHISLTLVKTVRAEGRTVEDLESELSERYRTYLVKPELTVAVTQATGNRLALDGRIYRAGFEDVRPFVMVRATGPLQVFVGGEVPRPGTLAYRSPMTALQAVIEAGGTKASGEMRSVTIIRKTAQAQPLVIRRDLLADLKQDGVTNDIYLRPSDIVIVPKTGIAEFAEFLDQYLFQILPPFRNSSFAFVYNLRERNGSSVVNINP